MSSKAPTDLIAMRYINTKCQLGASNLVATVNSCHRTHLQNPRDFRQRQNRSPTKSLCDVATSTTDEDAGSLVNWEVMRG